MHQKGHQRCLYKNGQFGKNCIFKCLLNYVKIDAGTWNFEDSHVVIQTDGKINFKFKDNGKGVKIILLQMHGIHK